jgi:hypothetical protein
VNGFAEEARGPGSVMYRDGDRYAVLERLAPNNWRATVVEGGEDEVLVDEGTRYEAEDAVEEWTRARRSLG